MAPSSDRVSVNSHASEELSEVSFKSNYRRLKGSLVLPDVLRVLDCQLTGTRSARYESVDFEQAAVIQTLYPDV